jgi:hypothetical protein
MKNLGLRLIFSLSLSDFLNYYSPSHNPSPIVNFAFTKGIVPVF